jgi:protein-L-isoaspartate(D-aspartate) O-methyltransferase
MIKSIKYNNPGLEKNIVRAFLACDRAFFVKQDPYSDMPQHIAHDQTISQPTTIARMLRILRLDSGLDILEIGTNTCYHACLVAYLIFPGKINTIEIYPDLANNAKRNLRILKQKISKKEAKRFSKIKIFSGDALNKKTPIWKQKYDRIYFTASVNTKQTKKVHEMARKLLKERGIILYPTREIYYSGALEIWQLKNKEMKLVRREEGYVFVPLQQNIK